MDLYRLASLGNANFTPLVLPSKSPISSFVKSTSVPPTFVCMATTQISTPSNIVRRSANYQPPIWHYDYIQSLTSVYVGESFTKRIDKLKGEVRMMFHKLVDPLERLKLIDILQRLGISYHFDDEIQRTLEGIHNANHSGKMCKKENIYATALEFRLLRQHGYSVPQEIFNSFKNEMGNFKACLCDDIEGMLCLYEASFYSIEGESILEEARDFATNQLSEYVKQGKDQNITARVNHALELPLHWRMLRLEVRWFIDVYRSREDMKPILLDLAELDFNMVQAAHQEDLKEMSRWWKGTDLGGKLSFARDRLMENFLWTVGVIFQTQFGYCRRISTKINVLITTIDDVYDVYGTLDELELFTDAVERWDTNAMDRLPYYMKICFLALHNSINEMAFDILKEQGFHIIPYLRKVWADICRSYLLEAKWYHSGYTPSLQEYIQNAWISISAPVILVHAYFLVTNPITNEGLDCLEEYPDIIRWSSMILRLADDLGTSKDELERGDVPKSIQCYMNETGASEVDAREYIKSLISETWKKMNKEGAASSPFSQTFIEIAMNLARMAQCMYQHGDGHGVEDRETKDRVLSLLIHPIPLHREQHEDH
ncbi:myrcene synthase, chloroplastic-like [Corylus avellana]|uniref:myrcene synthase, chloroplastic-like n=1 Tax=Corylus avellana TaxID=13451 RepID=UPI001E220D10|nr:myrcene synthase, chloroplastic-like [Corylus avellana]